MIEESWSLVADDATRVQAWGGWMQGKHDFMSIYMYIAILPFDHSFGLIIAGQQRQV